jgi:hypothetical protein
VDLLNAQDTWQIAKETKTNQSSEPALLPSKNMLWRYLLMM